ncbi:MAG: oligosaccharide flippase family protein [Bacteroidota bacterium]
MKFLNPLAGDKKSFVYNFFSLTALNVINYVFPIVMVPFLTRVLGLSGYGTYALALSWANIGLLFVRFGFDFSGVQEISRWRDEPQTLQKIFSEILFTRISFGLLVAFGMIFLSYFLARPTDLYLYLASLGILIGVSLNPNWLFQGMEKMQFYVAITSISRILFLVLVLFLVKSPRDSMLVMALNSLSMMLGGTLSLGFACRYFNLQIRLPSYSGMIKQIKNGWQLFLSTIGISFYRDFTTVIVGAVLDAPAVAIFSVCEKVLKVIQSLTAPIINALFPVFSRKFQLQKAEEFQNFIILGKKYALILTITSIVAFLSSPLIPFVFGPEYYNTVQLFRILIPIIIFGGLSYYIGVLGLVNLGRQKSFSSYVWFAGLTGLLCNYVLSSIVGLTGTGISLVFCEVLLFGLCLKELNKYSRQLTK